MYKTNPLAQSGTWDLIKFQSSDDEEIIEQPISYKENQERLISEMKISDFVPSNEELIFPKHDHLSLQKTIKKDGHDVKLIKKITDPRQVLTSSWANFNNTKLVNQALINYNIERMRRRKKKEKK